MEDNTPSYIQSRAESGGLAYQRYSQPEGGSTHSLDKHTDDDNDAFDYDEYETTDI